jgi:uncharacterized protein
MKSLGIIAIAGALAAGVPAQGQDNPVKAGVDAYSRGDYKAAIARWRPAADKGDADAQFNLGQAYKLGRGVKADLAQAEAWFRLAALQGHEQAEANYGLMLFENGKRAEAVPWLERSVVRGDPRTQYILGVMLFNGDAIAKNWVRAYALMTRASATGLDAASRTLAQMDQYIPLADRQAGQTLARTYESAANGLARPPAVAAVDGKATTPPPAPKPRVGISADPTATTAPPPAPKPATPTRATPPAPAGNPPATQDGGWRVQLGAFAVASNADRLWSQLRSRFPGRTAYQVKAGRLTKLLVGPFPSRARAAEACRGITPCVVVQE